MGWALLSSFGLWARWMTFGPFFSCLVYRGSPVLLGFGPLVDHWGVGFGPWWTEKNRPLHLANATTYVGTISDIGLRLLPKLSVSFIIPYGFSYHWSYYWLQCMMHLVLLGTVGTFVLFEMGILNWLIYLVGKSLAMFVEGFDSISLWLILTFILKGYYCCLL